MNASSSRHSFVASARRVLIAALLALTLTLVTASVSVAAVHEGTPRVAVQAEVVPSARDDCLAGRRRTGTSALRLGVDPVPSCATLLGHADDGRHSPGVLP
jgi:hypothetical protein